MISEKRIGGRPTTEVDDEAVVTLGLRVPGWLKRQLMEAAVENHRTLSQEARLGSYSERIATKVQTPTHLDGY